MSYGYGLSVTPLQTRAAPMPRSPTAAACTQPTFVQGRDDPASAQVLDPEIARSVLRHAARP